MSNKKLTVAVDIDEVLSDHAEEFIKFSNEFYGLNNTVDDYHEHWAELFKINMKELESLADAFQKNGRMKTLTHKKDSCEILTKLKAKYNLVVVTARRSLIREDTVYWLEERYPGIFEDVHFAGYWDEINEQAAFATKKEIMSKVGADFLIDDQPKHCEAVAEAGVTAILFGNYSWNKDYKPHKNIIKLHDWASVGDYLWNLQIK